MQLKITMRYHITPTSSGYNKKDIITSVVENKEKLEPSYIASGNINGAATLENSLQFLKGLNIYLLYNLAIPLLRYLLKRYKNIYPHKN